MLEREIILAERTRIAHELHDVVTHHVTAMVVQTEAGGFHPQLDAKTQQLLASIADGGRKRWRTCAACSGHWTGKRKSRGYPPSSRPPRSSPGHGLPARMWNSRSKASPTRSPGLRDWWLSG
ncbi:histidine kinase [Glutamicibacter sp. NPDC087583]